MTEETAPDRERESTAAARPPARTTSRTAAPQGQSDTSSSDGQGPARRRRRRGGRGRGGRGGGGAARTTDETTPEGADPETPSGDERKKAAPRAPRTRAPRARRPAEPAQGEAGPDEETEAARPAPARRRTRSTRTKRSSESGEPAEPEPTPDASAADAAVEPEEAEAATAARRRRRRGGRGRRRPGTTSAATGEGTPGGLAEAALEELPTEADRQREEALPDEAAEAAPAPKRTRARRGSKAAAKAEPKEPSEEKAERVPSTRRRRAEPGARRRRTTGTRRRREPPLLVHRRTDKRMLITEIGERDQIAVLEDRELVEHYVTRAGARSMVGNIYVGRVQNVLPGMEAAFIDVGRGRNGVLYAGEVNYDEEVEEGSQRIEEVLKNGQSVLVQVTKDPMGGKGARLTAQISLPGRFLVFVPNEQVFGISRRLPDAERTRLRDILKPIRPKDGGVIARTAAAGATAEDLTADLERLRATWEDVAKRSKRAKPPKTIYEEPELTVRVVRDLFTEQEFEELITDSPTVFENVTSYLSAVAPDLVQKVRMHDGTLPLMEEFHVAEQIRKALERKVWLPSGGYLVIDRTEAMTVVDVNTGKHVGKTNLEETVTKTNLEAADEIARQLRLRDIGGIIICDFIDMLLAQNQRKVIKAMKEALARDRTRSQVFEIGPLGLLELTRKKVSAGLVEAFSETCPTCEGRGILLTHEI